MTGRKQSNVAKPAQETLERQTAKMARLKYVTSFRRGFRRERVGDGFRYLDLNGRTIRDAETIDRIRGLVIPPAWEDVWISPFPNGHIQATGIDARGRKQYRYHARWRETRDDAKYQKLIRFAHALPQIRRRVRAHLKRPGLPREKILACIVKLLETTLIRVGNDEYATSNDSYGLTTMHDRHARVQGRTICFDFQGKSGVAHEIFLQDAMLAKVVRESKELPGRELFQYVDDEGVIHDVRSRDVNQYLKEIAGDEFTAKDFRTWAGTTLAAQALKEFEDFDSLAAAKRNIRQAIEKVAKRLGNTSAVCRKCYVHPAVITAYMDHSLLSTIQQRAESELRKSLPKLSAEEGAVLALLQRRINKHAHDKKSVTRL